MFLLFFFLFFQTYLIASCSMEMWCPDDIGWESWDWVGPPAWERACFNSPEWGGGLSRSRKKKERPQIVVVVVTTRHVQLNVSCVRSFQRDLEPTRACSMRAATCSANRQPQVHTTPWTSRCARDKMEVLLRCETPAPLLALSCLGRSRADTEPLHFHRTSNLNVKKSICWRQQFSQKRKSSKT